MGAANTTFEKLNRHDAKGRQVQIGFIIKSDLALSASWRFTSAEVSRVVLIRALGARRPGERFDRADDGHLDVQAPRLADR
jgi:hypothetical protein